MAKAKKQTQKQSQSKLMMALVAVVALVAVALVAASSGGGSGVDSADGTTLQKIAPVEYQAQFPDTSSHLLLDVRTPAEFASGHIPGAVNISVESLAGRLAEVPRDQPVVVYCRSGNRSVTASQILASAGYAQVYDMGGIIDWQAQGLPVVNN